MTWELDAVIACIFGILGFIIALIAIKVSKTSNKIAMIGGSPDISIPGTPFQCHIDKKTYKRIPSDFWEKHGDMYWTYFIKNCGTSRAVKWRYDILYVDNQGKPGKVTPKEKDLIHLPDIEPGEASRQTPAIWDKGIKSLVKPKEIFWRIQYMDRLRRHGYKYCHCQLFRKKQGEMRHDREMSDSCHGKWFPRLWGCKFKKYGRKVDGNIKMVMLS